jgi:hypothetical protein
MKERSIFLEILIFEKCETRIGGNRLMVHNIELSHFIPKGQVTCEYKDNALYMKTNHSIPTERFDAEHLSINSYIYLPDRYKLPLRIDMRVKIDAPGLYVLLGNGHINFGTLWSDNRRLDDIAAPGRKTMFYHNHLEMNQYTDISMLFDKNELQILIDGEERYYSKKERYMKSPLFRDLNEKGFEVKIACDKLVDLWIEDFSITEYEDTCGIVPSGKEHPAAHMKNNAISQGEKPDFEKCISLLPEEIQKEIVDINDYLKSLKPLNFKRQLEKNGNKITYIASEYGVSYAIYLSNDLFDHSLQWYIITNGKPETWHRKADQMEDTLNSLILKSPDFADRMFYSLADCVGCYSNCLAKTKYRLGDKQKTVCHGKLKFKMNTSGFADVRIFVDEINRIIQELEGEKL